MLASPHAVFHSTKITNVNKIKIRSVFFPLSLLPISEEGRITTASEC